MIQVKVRRDQNGAIREVEIAGHAGYADPGEDLVCAGVSAVTFGIANAIERLIGVQAVQEVGDSGYLHFVVPELSSKESAAQVQLLLEAMLVSLQSIEESYASYLSIREL